MNNHMRNFDFQKIVKWLGQVLRCPVCGDRYNLDQTKIIESKDGKLAISNLLVHTDCSHCKSSVVFSIAIDGPEIFSVGMVTDLTSFDTNKFKNYQPITSNDVLAIHQFLTGFNGDFQSYLKK